MRIRANAIAFKTILLREIRRFIRIWIQTVLPPAITMSLYFVIFGRLIGPQIGEIDGLPYIQYIVPGLIMMAIITNAYSNVVSSFYSAKFQHHVEEMLVAPVPNHVILLGFMAGGVARGLVVGVAVTLVALLFTDWSVHHPGIMVLVVLLTAMLFSLGGFMNAIYARSFDDIAIVPTFVLTPLTYLGGVFYSVDMLPEFWRSVSWFNPILYMVNAFRYSVLGVSDVNLSLAFAVMVLLVATLFTITLWLLERGVGIKS